MLVETTGSTNAFVVDTGPRIWCRAHPVSDDRYESLARQIAAVKDSTDPPLQKGGAVDGTPPGYSQCYFRSFANAYLLVLWFPPANATPWVRAAVKRALPRIESLTLALPPPDGPSVGEGVIAKHRA